MTRIWDWVEQRYHFGESVGQCNSNDTERFDNRHASCPLQNMWLNLTIECTLLPELPHACIRLK